MLISCISLGIRNGKYFKQWAVSHWIGSCDLGENLNEFNRSGADETLEGEDIKWQMLNPEGSKRYHFGLKQPDQCLD